MRWFAKYALTPRLFIFFSVQITAANDDTEGNNARPSGTSIGGQGGYGAPDPLGFSVTGRISVTKDAVVDPKSSFASSQGLRRSLSRLCTNTSGEMMSAAA